MRNADRVALLVLYRDADPDRPSTRGDCSPGGKNEERPCPYVGCRHHLGIEVSTAGDVREVFPGLELEQMRATCALDVATEGGLSLEDVAVHMNVSRERVRQIQDEAVAKQEAAFIALRDGQALPQAPAPAEQPTPKERRCKGCGRPIERVRNTRYCEDDACRPPALLAALARIKQRKARTT